VPRKRVSEMIELWCLYGTGLPCGPVSRQAALEMLVAMWPIV
jgi:hypothetical protein